ncbi:hypothetical protein [Brevibacterium litoralis]|uniref:hypothetical protein n=1 Tax=Brevibacterium litoralis TaxID=3138935 RepID=UPI0032F06ACD
MTYIRRTGALLATLALGIGGVLLPGAAAASADLNNTTPTATELPDPDTVERLSLEELSPSPERAGEIAQALAEDPLYLAEGQENYFTSTQIESLESGLATTEYPMYVVVVAEPEVQSGEQVVPSDYLSDLAGMISVRLEGEGLLYVVGPDSFGAQDRVRALESETYWLLQEQTYTTVHDPDRDMSLQEFTLDTVERMQDPQETESPSTNPIERLFRDMLYFAGRYPAIAIGIVVAVLAGAGALIWFIARRAPRVKKKYVVPDAVLKAAKSASRKKLEQELGQDALQVSTRLQNLQAGSLSEADSRRVQHGLDAYTLARRIAEDEASRPDDLMGALVLFEMAENDLARVEAPAGGTSPHRPCAVNPGHGESKGEISVTEYRTRAGKVLDRLDVPACGKCMRDHRADNPLQWLRVDGQPYLERDTAWARTLFGSTDADLVAEVIRERALS